MKLQFRNLHYATRLYPKEAACPIKQDFSPGAAVIVYVFFLVSFFLGAICQLPRIGRCLSPQFTINKLGFLFYICYMVTLHPSLKRDPNVPPISASFLQDVGRQMVDCLGRRFEVGSGIFCGIYLGSREASRVGL